MPKKNHVPSQNSPKSPSTQNMSSDDIPNSASPSFQQISGVENDGFDDSIENVLEENSSQTYLSTNSQSDGFANQVSNSSFSQDDDVEKTKDRNILERSATTRNVDIKLDDSPSMTESGDTKTHVNNITNAEQNSTEYTRSSTMNKYDNSNAVLFFIHGVGGSVDVWRQQLDYFLARAMKLFALILSDMGSVLHHTKSQGLHFRRNFCRLASNIRHVLQKAKCGHWTLLRMQFRCGTCKTETSQS